MARKSPIEIYKSPDGEIVLEVQLDKETIRLPQKMIAILYWVEPQNITYHISNIYKEGELGKEWTCKEILQVQVEGSRQVKREIVHYNLDMIISIGYRVNSQKATHFRQRATSILKQHLIDGYTLNKARVQQTGMWRLQRAIELMKHAIENTDKISRDEVEWLVEIIDRYAQSRLLLHQYDKGELPTEWRTILSQHQLLTKQAQQALDELKINLLNQWTASALFALPTYHGAPEWIFWNIYQSFDGKELYPSAEAKAAHLLYFIIKDHPFSDGNKRSWAFLFIIFLQQYGILYDQDGYSKLNDKWLVALALLIAQSDPKDKGLMIQLIINLINE